MSPKHHGPFPYPVNPNAPWDVHTIHTNGESTDPYKVAEIRDDAQTTWLVESRGYHPEDETPSVIGPNNTWRAAAQVLASPDTHDQDSLSWAQEDVHEDQNYRDTGRSFRVFTTPQSLVDHMTTHADIPQSTTTSLLHTGSLGPNTDHRFVPADLARITPVWTATVHLPMDSDWGGHTDTFSTLADAERHARNRPTILGTSASFGLGSQTLGSSHVQTQGIDPRTDSPIGAHWHHTDGADLRGFRAAEATKTLGRLAEDTDLTPLAKTREVIAIGKSLAPSKEEERRIVMFEKALNDAYTLTPTDALHPADRERAIALTVPKNHPDVAAGIVATMRTVPTFEPVAHNTRPAKGQER